MMGTYIAMLRGINVSGQKKIKMADLRDHLAELKFGNIETYIQSGNILFDSSERPREELEAMIAGKIKEKYGFDVPTLVKTPAEMQTAIDGNPYTGDPEKLERTYLTFLGDDPASEKVAALDEVSYEPEEFVIEGRNIYFYSPKGYGKAKMNNNFFENKLKVAATTRNWKTVNKLRDMAAERD